MLFVNLPAVAAVPLTMTKHPAIFGSFLRALRKSKPKVDVKSPVLSSMNHKRCKNQSTDEIVARLEI